MGYYSAGGAIQMRSSHTTVDPGPSSSPPSDRPKRRARIDLTALRKAQRRVDRFVKLAKRMVPHVAGHRIRTGKKRGRK